jgi:tRNA1Val (adenine37-N6)-methyltransferase
MRDSEKPDTTLDVLAGDWRIFQLRRGHRFSTDDLLTAWAAVRAKPEARRLLDLGAGIGSVGLLTLWRLPADAELTMVEVQEVSQALARRTVRYNGLSARVSLRRQDLRYWPGGRYDLVTGSPPYLPSARGTCPPHAQKAAARFELHGDVFDYCAAAARSLAASGIFCFCHRADDPRPLQAIARASLRLVSRQLVYFREGLPPPLALFTCAWQGGYAEPPPLIIRDRQGRWTAAYLAVREEMGAPAAFLRWARMTPDYKNPPTICRREGYVMTQQDLPSTLQAFCEQAELLRLAYLDRQGYPRVVPVWFVIIDGHYYIGIGSNSPKWKAIRRNARVGWVVDGGTRGHYKGASMRGRAAEVRDAAERQHVYEALGRKYYGAVDDPQFVEIFGPVDEPETTYLRLTPEEGLTWEH